MDRGFKINSSPHRRAGSEVADLGGRHGGEKAWSLALSNLISASALDYASSSIMVASAFKAQVAVFAVGVPHPCVKRYSLARTSLE
jgi:hypothetical protein